MTTGENNELYAEQVRQLYAAGAVALWASLLNGPVVVFVLWNFSAPAILLPWLSSLCAVTALRYGLLYRFKRSVVTPAGAPRWAALFSIGAFLSGSVWGSACVVLFPEDMLALQVFLAFVLGGMAAGATTVYAASRSTLFASIVPMLIPLVIRFFSIGTDIHLAMGALTIVFTLLMLINALKNHSALQQSLKLRFENRRLISGLEEAKQQGDIFNEKLLAEIKEREATQRELTRHRNNLSELVREKTAELQASHKKLEASEQELRAANQQLQANYQQLAESQDAVRKANEFLESMLQAAFDGIIVSDDKGCIVRTNRALEAMVGYSKEELQGKHMAELAPQEQQYIDIAGNMMLLLRKKGFVENFETCFLRKDGTYCPVEFNVSYVKDESGGIRGAFSSIRNITERKQAEEALRASEERFRSVVETATDAIITVNRAGTIVFWNKAAETIFGYAGQEACGSSYAIILPEQYQPGMRDWMEYIFTNDDVSFPREPFEGFAVKKDGTEFLVEISLSFWKAGSDFFSTALIRDITSRKKTEQQIREARDFLDNIFKTSADGIVIAAKQSIILMVNDAMERILGYSREELVGKALSTFVPDEEQYYKKGIEFISRLFEEGLVSCVEQQYRHKDGHIVDVEISAALLNDSRGTMTGSVAVFRDITERKKAQAEKKKLEEQLQRSEKMETIGLLAGGVAHDLNNMLGAIIGYPELLLNSLPQDSSLRKPLQAIQDSGERAAAIVQDLLTLTRRGVSVHETVNLNAITRKYFESREWEKLKEFHPQILLRQQLDPALLNMVGSPVHLLKVIANLMSNAAEATTGAGTIRIATENRHLDAPLKGYDQIVAGDYVVLSVQDTGSGIAEPDQQRIFEPFYTKKVMGRSGTGLGMSVVWGTVKDHGGYIDLVSREGKGTTITIYFPATSKEIQEQETAFSLDSYTGSGQTILVIDDVETQRDIARAILTRLGYRVMTVASGEEAVQYLQSGTADLLVLDMIMDPGMDGLDTYRTILELHPGQKAIIASGYSETDRVRQAQGLGAGAYVKKPYTIEKLGQAVKNALARE